MKLFAIIVVTLILLICIYFILLSATAKAPETGLVDGLLRPCSTKPNCVTSEASGVQSDQQKIAPIMFPNPSEWQSLANIITSQGGTVKQHDSHYLIAEYRSATFRFVDDLELR
ncbi:MAG: DUF1499 domain-containing protein [Gammaproteobacteria bacterium]|nr:DUF1499 domain-containing protein [Gammaproteobacteria bacterium]